MKKIKIFNALDQLDTYELNRFEKYVNSPYFNSSDALKQIVGFYESQRKKGKLGILDKSVLWSKAFPGKTFSDGRLRKALSDLLRLFEDFLCLEHMNNHPLFKATMLVEALEDRKLELLYNSSVKNAKKLTSEDNEVSARMHYHRYELEKVYYELTDFDIKRNEESNLSQIISNLDHFYLAEKLKYYCTGISRKSYINSDIELLFIDEIKAHITSNKYQDTPIVNIWILIYQLQNININNSKESYLEFKSTFERIAPVVPSKEAIQIFGYGQNFCAGEINKGDETYFQELFDLNRIAIDNGILIQKNELDPWLFRNIVTVALRLKEYNWTESFIDDHAKYITEEFRINAESYSKALLAFYQQKYDHVLNYISEVEMKDISYELNTKSLLILTYYEMEATDALASLLDSFSVYLNRHKDISKARRDNYSNMISFTRRLMNTLPSDKKAHEKMLTKLEETKGIASGAWLKEKILERLS